MAKKTEKAVILNPKEKYLDKKMKGYDVIYTGSYFCSNIIPDITEIDDMFKKGAKKIALQTSFLTQDSIESLKIKLSKIFYSFKNLEILINDPGLIEFLNKKYPSIRKGIGIPLSYDFMRMEENSLNRFMNRYKLDIIETDEDYLINNFKNRDFMISFNLPAKFAGVSRFCPYTRKITSDCDYECLNKSKKLRTADNHIKIISFENAYFYLRKKINFKKYDRSVILPL